VSTDVSALYGSAVVRFDAGGQTQNDADLLSPQGCPRLGVRELGLSGQTPISASHHVIVDRTH
jgi:hypothetical protein